MTSTTTQRQAPALTIDGTHAVLTAVLFTWAIRCWNCRAVSHISAEGGRILAGMTVSVSKKTCRWYQTDKPPAMPALPDSCAECGETDRPFYYAAEERGPLAHHSALPVLNVVWETLRAQYPALVAKADAARDRQNSR